MQHPLDLKIPSIALGILQEADPEEFFVCFCLTALLLAALLLMMLQAKSHTRGWSENM